MVENIIYIVVHLLSIIFMVKIFHKDVFKRRTIELAGYTLKNIHVLVGAAYGLIVFILFMLLIGRIVDVIYILINSR